MSEHELVIVDETEDGCGNRVRILLVNDKETYSSLDEFPYRSEAMWLPIGENKRTKWIEMKDGYRTHVCRIAELKGFDNHRRWIEAQNE